MDEPHPPIASDADPTAPGYAVEPGPIRPPSRGGRRRRLLVGGAVVVVAAGVLAVALVGRGLGPPAPKPPPRIALIDPAGALAIVDAQGANRETHADPGTTFLFPVWSPDGTRVAAVAQSSDAASVEVFAGSGTGAGTVVYRSATEAPFYVYWTPDGRGVTFLTNGAAGEIALRAAPADGGVPATVIRTGAPMYWAWADPGRMLVHTGGDAAGAFLGEVASDGRVASTVGQAPGNFRSPAVSSDGRFEAYVASTAEVSSVVVAGRDGSSAHEVQVFGPTALGFSADGSELAFLAAADAPDPVPDFPFGPLRLVDPRSGAVRTLVSERVIGFFWSPDGRTIAALLVPNPANPGSALRGGPAPGAGLAPTAGSAVLAAARAGTASPSRVLSAGVAPAAALDRPGADLTLDFVDVATGTVRSEATVRVSPLFVSQILPFFDQYALSHRVWAPDSASILLPAIADDGSEVLDVLPADGSAPRVLAPGSIGFWSP